MTKKKETTKEKPKRDTEPKRVWKQIAPGVSICTFPKDEK